MENLDAALAAVAQHQHGMLTTTQLRTAGLDAQDLVDLVRRGTLLHPGRGLYAVAELASDDKLVWHRQLVAGAFLLYPDAMLTGTTAVLSFGLPVWGTNVDKPHLLRPRDRSGGMKSFTIRRSGGRPEAVAGPWGPCVPLADALVQVALDAGILPGVVSADAALQSGRVSEQDLAAAVERVRSWPHSSRATAMYALKDGRRESVAESRTGVILTFAGIELIPQVTITDERGNFVARVDFVVKGTRVVVEFDGRVKYEDGRRMTLFDEKRREDRLRRLGYVVVRLTWSDLEKPGRAAMLVRQAMAAAA